MSSKTGGAGESAPATQGSGDRGPRRRNPHRNRGRSDSRSGDKAEQKPISKAFVGKEEGLGDEYVYQLTSGNEASVQYTRTTAEIVRFTSTKYKNGGDVERSLTDGVRLVIPVPPPPDGTVVNQAVVPPPDSEVQVWKMRASMALQREAMLESNLESAYALITGQCSEAIIEKVKAQTDYTAVHGARDPIRLLELVRSVMFQYNSRKYRAVAIIEIIDPSIVSQTRYMTDSDYLEKFRAKLSVLTSAGGTVTSHPGIVEDELRTAGIIPNAATDAQLEQATLRAQGRWTRATTLDGLSCTFPGELKALARTALGTPRFLPLIL
jgi:hypothetical protein